VCKPSAPWAVLAAWFPLMPCRSFALKRPRLRRSLERHREASHPHDAFGDQRFSRRSNLIFPQYGGWTQTLVQQCNDRFGRQGKAFPRLRAPQRLWGFLGGPIQKDKAFLFLFYEGARLDQPQTQVVFVPLNMPGLARPLSRLSMNAYPQPDDRTVTPGVFAAHLRVLFRTVRLWTQRAFE